MLYLDYTQALIKMQGVLVKKVATFSNLCTIDIEMSKKCVICPNCSAPTSNVHDYRYQKIKDLQAFGMNVILNYHKRRYACKQCGKRFSEPHPFVPKYHRMTNRLVARIIDLLSSERSFTSVARETNVSISTVIRVFDCVSYGRPTTLPKVLAIDEFKGNTGTEKYQVILTDPETKKVLDILPCRKQTYMLKYLKQWTILERMDVRHFVSDMWLPYTDLASCLFKNATQVIDRYHFIRQMVWAFERVRKRVQKKFSKNHRLLFKHSRKLLLKRSSKLNELEKEKLNSILYISNDMLNAYHLKELFYKIMDSNNREEAKTAMSEWITLAEGSNNYEYKTCARTLINWQKGILNSFDVPYSNGFTEGCNNKIKVLKRNAYGFRNFNRFRNRILHMFNAQTSSSTA